MSVILIGPGITMRTISCFICLIYLTCLIALFGVVVAPAFCQESATVVVTPVQVGMTILKPLNNLDVYGSKAVYDIENYSNIKPIYDISSFSNIKPAFDISQRSGKEAYYNYTITTKPLYDISQATKVKPIYDISERTETKPVRTVGNSKVVAMTWLGQS
jgi:hypothetical protein